MALWRRLRSALALAAVIGLLQGCAATGPRGIEMASRLNDIPSGFGRVVFYRSDSLVGAVVQPEIRFAGQVVGQSKPGGFFYVDAVPGRYTATVATEATSSVEVQVVAGQTHYVRSAVSFGFAVGRVTLSIEGMVTAKGELQSLSYTGTQVPRIGDGHATASAAASAAPVVVQQAQALKRGDRVVYRLS